MPVRSKKLIPLTRRQKIIKAVKKPVTIIANKSKDLRARRPHRSFVLTRRRDYKRSLELPGYFSFAREVHQMLWKYRKTFILLVIFYSAALVVTVGITSQDAYTSLTATLQQTSSEVFKGDISKIGDAGALVTVIATTGLSADSLTEGQQVYVIILTMLVWLTAIWLLRNLLAGNKVKLRDGLYSAGSPIVATFMLVCVILVQLLPLALAILAYSAASTTGLLNSGVEAMLFWICAGLLTLISLYLISSSFIALIIVTIPGTYPFVALRLAGDMIIGRRLRLLFRLLYLGVVIIVGWTLVMGPIILLDAWIKSIWTQLVGVPIIPVAAVIMTPLTIVWSASYIYLLYRKMIEDDAEPA
ncbi:MAG: hypothetical protein ABIP50_02230 [Candidatus Saccharimonadales bacterium]